MCHVAKCKNRETLKKKRIKTGFVSRKYRIKTWRKKTLLRKIWGNTITTGAEISMRKI